MAHPQMPPGGSGPDARLAAAIRRVAHGAAEELGVAIPEDRLTQAVQLATSPGAVIFYHDDTASVRIPSGKTYTLDGGCDCADAPRTPWCKHALAVWLTRRAHEALGQSMAPTAASSAGDAQALMPRHVVVDQHHHGMHMSEAPFSATYKCWKDGYECLVTVRKPQSGQHAFYQEIAALPQWLDQMGFRSCPTAPQAPPPPATALPVPVPEMPMPQPAAPPVPAATPNGSGSNWCPLHEVWMTRRRNERGSWYSHLLDDGTWCKGKPSAA